MSRSCKEPGITHYSGCECHERGWEQRLNEKDKALDVLHAQLDEALAKFPSLTTQLAETKDELQNINWKYETVTEDLKHAQAKLEQAESEKERCVHGCEKMMATCGCFQIAKECVCVTWPCLACGKMRADETSLEKYPPYPGCTCECSKSYSCTCNAQPSKPVPVK